MIRFWIFSSFCFFSLFPIQKGVTTEAYPSVDSNLIGGNYQIMQFLDHELSENGIKYWLAFGSLLGAYRHGGMIPWADTISIGIMYQDADQFLNLVPSFLDRGLCLTQNQQGYYKLSLIGQELPRIEIFLCTLDNSYPKKKVRLSGDPFYEYPQCYWYPSDLKEFRRIPFGPIEVSIPSTGILNHLFRQYESDCLTHAKHWNHSERLDGKVKIQNFAAANFRESIPQLSSLVPRSQRGAPPSLGRLWEEPSHITLMAQLLDEVLFSSMLQLGVGQETEFFIHKLQHLDSVFFIENETTQSIVDRLMPFSKWTGRVVDKKDWSEAILDEQNYDIAFVNAAPYHKYGKMVNHLMKHIPVIVTYNTALPAQEYGWKDIEKPSPYLRYDFTVGSGLTIWVHRDRLDMLYALEKIRRDNLDIGGL